MVYFIYLYYLAERYLNISLAAHHKLIKVSLDLNKTTCISFTQKRSGILCLQDVIAHTDEHVQRIPTTHLYFAHIQSCPKTETI